MGEATHLDRQERIQLIRALRSALDENGLHRTPIIAGVGATSTRETISLAKEAAAAGAEFVLVIAPSYYASELKANPNSIKTFFIDVAFESPLPVCGNVGKVSRITSLLDESFKTIAGFMDFLLPSISVGSAGAISPLPNIVPDFAMELWRSTQSLDSAADWAKTRLLQEKASLAEAELLSGGVAGLKYLLNQQFGYPATPRRPLQPLGEDTAARLSNSKYLKDLMESILRALLKFILGRDDDECVKRSNDLRPCFGSDFCVLVGAGNLNWRIRFIVDWETEIFKVDPLQLHGIAFAQVVLDDAAVPPGMATGDNIWINNGDLSCTDEETLPPFERATIESMEQSGYPDTQLVNNNPQYLRLAKKKGLAPHMQPFAKKLLGVFDTTGGITLADKACRFALHKAKRLGVQFVLNQTAGKVISIVQDSAGRASGISTVDGKTHQAALTIAACGGWTPTLIPESDGFAETTARCVVIFKLPEDLRERFSPSRFPAWSFKIADGAETGLYGFPVDENGLLKIGYRGTKYTNPKVQSDGHSELFL
ncbi:hypothetical protein LZL87_013834 [Fusarium oxysporum]|nr:hypothetical protein LZL87_013834 [Fusarium oxysporum]